MKLISDADKGSEIGEVGVRAASVRASPLLGEVGARVGVGDPPPRRTCGQERHGLRTVWVHPALVVARDL